MYGKVIMLVTSVKGTGWQGVVWERGLLFMLYLFLPFDFHYVHFTFLNYPWTSPITPFDPLTSNSTSGN